MLLMLTWTSEVHDSSHCWFCKKYMGVEKKSWRWYSMGDVKIRVHISCYNQSKKRDLSNQPAHLAGKHCVHPVSGCCLCK